MNATDRPQRAPIPAGAKVILGNRDVPIAGVTVWQ
jgi:hypothetical protein